MGQDVTILAPTAEAGLKVPAPGRAFDPPTPEELVRLYGVDNDRLRREMRELGDTASAISAVALALVKLYYDAGFATGPNEVTIPKGMHDSLVGASITITNDTEGNILVQLAERGLERIHVI